jgi:uncharacterized SAM-binding protein YcdF (DUF218 family)
VTFNYALSDLVLPPTSLILATLAGALLLRRWRRLGIALIVLAQAVLLALAMPAIASALSRALEPPPVTAADLQRAQVIVILAGGNNRGAPEWGGETVKTYTLQRLRYGARLARETGLPVYVTGGRPEGGRFAEATLMRNVLVDEYRLPVLGVDTTAMTTGENAMAAARDLRPQGLTRVALVTDAVHMPRSRQVFEAAGLEVIACPTAYAGQRPFRLAQLVPGAAALQQSQAALREWASGLYYRLRYSERPATRETR